MDASTFQGEQHKSITITSNDPDRPSITVPLEANIVRDIVADPTFFPAMSDIVAGREFETQVMLQNTGTSAITVQQPHLSQPVSAVISFEPRQSITLQPGDSVAVVAHVKPISEGMLQAEVVVPTSSASSPEVKLTLATMVAGS